MYFDMIDRVELNPTELCNLKCSFCPRSKGYPNSNLNMSERTALEIRKQLDACGYDRKVSITGRGEPTLTRDFKRLLYIMLENNPRYDVYMNTNGKKLDELSDMFHLFWRINLDVYDTDVSVYEQALDKYSRWDNIDVRHRPDDGSGYMSYNDKNQATFSNRGGKLVESRLNSHGKQACGFIFNKVFINWNGDYNLCCDDWTAQIKMSTIWEQSIEDYVNNNSKLAHYRHMHLNGQRDCLHVCGSCDRVATINNQQHLLKLRDSKNEYNIIR